MTRPDARRGRHAAAAQRANGPASSSAAPSAKPVEERDALFGRLTGQMIRLRRQQRRRRVQKRIALLLLVLAAVAGYWHAYTPEAATQWKALIGEVRQWTAAQLGRDPLARDPSARDAPWEPVNAAAADFAPPTLPHTAGRRPIPASDPLDPPAASPTRSPPQT